MDTQQALKYQQLEFFLLHSLIVDELHMLRHVNRITPATAKNVQGGAAILSRLFRSFLVKVFPPTFRISKKQSRLDFNITSDLATQQFLNNTKDSDSCLDLRTLLPKEMGILRFSFPNCLYVTLSGHRMRRSRYYQTTWSPADLGIDHFCDGAKAVLTWKKRFDKAMLKTSFVDVLPEKQTQNFAQEQLEAIIRNAKETGKL
jgi:hypothetical protein